VGDPAFTMTLCGNFFASCAVASFGATALTTSQPAAAAAPCPTTATQQVTAQVPASALTAVAEIPVTIKNPQSNASNSIPYYVGMNIYFDESSDVVWDSQLNLLYVSKPSTAQHSQDSIIALSPHAGLNDTAAPWIYQFPAGSNPGRLALSADGKYLYVALDGAGSVQQLVITSATTPPTLGTTIPLGSDPTYGAYYALDMAVDPANTTTIAVARGIAPSQSHLTTLALGGVAIYDGTTQRPNFVGPAQIPGGSGLLDTLQWSAFGYSIYAANNENSDGDMYTLDVSANGAALAPGGDTRGIFSIPNLYIHLDPASGLLYGDDGLQVDPGGPLVVGNAKTNGIMIPDSAGGKAYFVSHPNADPNVLRYFVTEFDLATLTPGASLDLYQVQGIPQHLVRWDNSSDGSKGVAFTTKKFNCPFTPCQVGDGRLYVIDLPF